MFPIVVKLQITELNNGGVAGLFIGKNMYARFIGNKPDLYAQIKSQYKLIGQGKCEKEKTLDLYLNPADNKVSGISLTVQGRCFDIAETAI